MVVDCKDLPDALADLKHPRCRQGILTNLLREFRVESVVLSHYYERQYGKASLDVLERILALHRLLEQMAARPPSPRFPHLGRKQVRAKCAACPFNPGTLFPRLRAALHTDFRTFHRTFLEGAEALHRYREKGCRTCVQATGADLLYLYRETEAFGEHLLTVRPAREEGP
jgi:hypothetical protein